MHDFCLDNIGRKETAARHFNKYLRYFDNRPVYLPSHAIISSVPKAFISPRSFLSSLEVGVLRVDYEYIIE